MRTRKLAADCGGDPNLQDRLGTLHGSTNGVSHNDDTERPKTLGDISKQSVNKLLDRVGAKRAAAKKRELEQGQQRSQKRRRGKGKAYTEDDLLYQRGVVTSDSAPICGALAKVERDAASSQGTEISGTPNERSNLGAQYGNVEEEEEAVHRAVEASTEDDEEFEWEQGEGANNCSGALVAKGGTSGETGDIIVRLGNEAEKSKAIIRKQPARRANARDKEFAELVHKAHLLCLLARGRILDATCDDPLLQASILSMLPQSVSLFNNIGNSNIVLLRTFTSWFSETFQVIPPEARSSGFRRRKSLVTQLIEVSKTRCGTPEEVGALAVAFLRGLGFTTRYVASFEVAPLKPDAKSLKASDDWDPKVGGEGIMYSAYKEKEAEKVESLTRLVALAAFQANMNGSLNVGTPSMDQLTMDQKQSNCHTGADVGMNKTVNAGTSHVTPESQSGDVIPQVKAYSRRKRGPSEVRGSPPGIKGDSCLRAQDVGEASTRLLNKGDMEFQTQLALAMCATAAAKSDNQPCTTNGLNRTEERKRVKGRLEKKLGIPTKGEGSSKKVPESRMSAPLYWAEVYVFEDSDGRWIHVDAARDWVNGADKVEGAAPSGHGPPRYVIAFAGKGAKDVTRRYVRMWSSVSGLRADENWWASTLHPLKQLEAAVTAGVIVRKVHQEKAPSTQVKDSALSEPGSSQQERTKRQHEKEALPKGHTSGARESRTARSRTLRISQRKNNKNSTEPAVSACDSTPQHVLDRSALEDMELETKTYTEPLPTSQQAYKAHHLYALERWLTKYQTLHPKGPVLGYCAGQPVYPRTSVQMLHTPDRWLREGLKVREGEEPAKTVKANHLAGKSMKQAAEAAADEEKAPPPTTDLFGKWQCDPWRPPRAENGVVPKNERGQVDCWSEYCIPPGTVHLRYPRLVPIVKRLGIDFAPAMVGFEIRKRRSVPKYEGVVVCEEFKDAIMTAYEAEEDIRFGELRRKREEMAIKRWRELLLSMATRERLKAVYEGCPLAIVAKQSAKQSHKKVADECRTSVDVPKREVGKIKVGHVHTFPPEGQVYDEEAGVRTKVCPCGFSVQIEEM